MNKKQTAILLNTLIKERKATIRTIQTIQNRISKSTTDYATEIYLQMLNRKVIQLEKLNNKILEIY